MLTGSGGWPMTVFLTPGLQALLRRHLLPARRPPQYARLPPPAGDCCPGLPQQPLRNPAGHRAVDRADGPHRQYAPRRRRLWTRSILHNAYNQLATNFDYQNGGVGSAPKFPQAMTLEILLRYYAHGHNDRARLHAGPDLGERWLAAAFTTRLPAGSIVIPPIPTGWCLTSRRCSTTTLCWPAFTCMPGWPPGAPVVPPHHRGNAGLRAAGNDRRSTAVSSPPPTPTARARKASSSSGRRRKSRPVLGSEDAALFNAFFGVSQRGNFEGKNILNISVRPPTSRNDKASRLERLCSTSSIAAKKRCGRRAKNASTRCWTTRPWHRGTA